MLSGEELLALIERAQAGDDQAKGEIVEHNVPLIKSIVRRYKNKLIEYDDLMQLGTLGLVKAINNFNPAFGVRFSTYAVPMIAGEIKRFIRDDGAIKVSRSVKARNQQITRYAEEYKAEHGEEASVDHLCERFDIDPAELIFILDSARYPVSIYAENDEDGLTLADRISAKGSEEETIDKMVLFDAISALPEREKKIIMLRYFRDKTQSEIALELGVSQVQISRLESRILEKLRKEML